MEVYIVFVCENGEYIGHGLYEDQSYVYGVYGNKDNAIEVTNVLQAKGENAYMQPFTVE